MNNTKEYKLIFFPQLGIYGQVGPTSAEIMTTGINEKSACNLPQTRNTQQ